MKREINLCPIVLYLTRHLPPLFFSNNFANTEDAGILPENLLNYNPSGRAAANFANAEDMHNLVLEKSITLKNHNY
jgi:hypothetical protein